MYLTSIEYHDQIEKPVSFIFQRMEDRGVMLDLPYLNELKTKLEELKTPLEAEIKKELGDINLSSPIQLLEALHEKNIEPTWEGKPSTDKRGLARFSSKPIVANLLKYSELDTLLSTFVVKYLERKTDTVRPHFNQCGTRTGRPSCSNPNLLQIPKRTDNGKLVRRMFIARPGHSLGDCDFGQIEPRVMAHLSKDPDMLRMFNDEIDFHTYTSERLFHSSEPKFRDRAKILNLSVGYRATFKSVSEQLKCSFAQAQTEIDRWWNMFPDLWDWQQKLIHEARKTGYCTTLMGRRIKIDDLNHNNKWRREGAERQLMNNITQASAGEIMKLGMISVNKAGVNILVQVYDELLFEEKTEVIDNALQVVADCMRDCIKLDVPLTVDGGSGLNWSECK
jgi:DNA polymerase-1